MITYTNIYNAKRFCCEDISKIENYDKAINDKSDTVWDCHHKLGIIKTKKELQEMGLYYNRPASELMFLTHNEHRYLHNLFISIKIREKLSKSSKKLWESQEYREKHRIANTGRHLSEKTRDKISKAVKGKPKRKYIWLTPDGEEIIMSKNIVVRYHKEWKLIGPA